MRKICILVLPLMALFITGCPHKDYAVKLTPHGEKMRRELVFYQADDPNSNGIPKCESFPQEELDAITALYPSGAVTQKGDVHTAKGEFSAAMPSDVGGAGTYTNLTTSMGSAGFYGERFRGNDDLAGQIEKRIAAANQLTDLLIGWSQAELGAETNYPALHKFLETNFRQDVKNASFYWKRATTEEAFKTNTPEEYEVRFAQYLLERGYFKLSDLPDLSMILADGSGNDARLMGFIQRLVARRLGVDDKQPLPASLAFLGDSDSLEKSFEKYFVGTELYRDAIAEWTRQPEPRGRKPVAGDIIKERFDRLIELNFFGEQGGDHLTVKLSLPAPPAHSNGKWDEINKQVVWDSDIESKTNAVQLPVICYASWGQPEETFQKQHFGRAVLTGENLTMYCLWRAGLNEKQAVEWEKVLAALQPGAELNQKVKDFRFSDEKAVKDNEQQTPSYMVRSLFEGGLEEKADAGGK